MLQTIRTIQFSDDDPKMKILSRLVREGHITLEEAFVLSETHEQVQRFAPISPNTVPLPNIERTPYPYTPWFGINNPVTGKYDGPTWTTTSTSLSN